ncbi:chymotrypsin-elastase inhibitor ixodidin-like [Tribolium madens]|uniref:chymotrypsin-elastase inhibitor ixodidin-like n=1 Tax=Tribolium madens TaxID=41895 RepID=UPI001CF71DFF|nr:chymotrypsin-elastase inhibitor ixodidin-like [Tribolium madens]
MMFGSSFVLLAFAATVAVLGSETKFDCSREGEEYKHCGYACPFTCTQPQPRLCTLQCVPGCFCKRGLFRDERSGECVTKSQCNEIMLEKLKMFYYK